MRYILSATVLAFGLLTSESGAQAAPTRVDTQSVAAPQHKAGPDRSAIAAFSVFGGDETDRLSVVTSQFDATVIIFVSNKCPVSNAYNARMNALYKDYNGKNVQFVFLNPNINETGEDLKALGETAKLGAKAYHDRENNLANRFEANFTPEVVILDHTGNVRYTGAIDDSRDESKVTKNYVRDAIDALKAGKEVPVAKSKAFGCTIKRKKTA